MAEHVTVLNEFYKLCKNNRLNTNFDLYETLVSFQENNKDIVNLFWCENDLFSSSMIVSIQINQDRVALFYLDAYNCDIIRINFSYHRFKIFTQNLQKIEGNLVPTESSYNIKKN